MKVSSAFCDAPEHCAMNASVKSTLLTSFLWKSLASKGGMKVGRLNKDSYLAVSGNRGYLILGTL